MGLKLNVFCNGQIVASQKYLDNMDNVTWGPGHVERCVLGLPIKKENGNEVNNHADLQK